MSGYDDDVGVPEERSSVYRQDLRERLRQREQKLLDLIRSSQTSSRSGILRNGTRSVGKGNGGTGSGESNRLLDLAGRTPYDYDDSEVLDDIGSGSSRSKYRYDSRRSSQGDDASNGEVRARLAGIERVSSQQRSRIEFLETTLLMRQAELDELRDALVTKLERIVSLEIELMEGGRSDLEEEDLEAVNKLTTARQSQLFFTQLLGDLRELELVYKDERLKSSALQDQLLLENEILRRDVAKSIASLDERLERADNERRRLVFALAEREGEVQELKRNLADLRLRAVVADRDDVFDDRDVDQLESRSANRQRVRQDQEEAVERARRETSSIRPVILTDQSPLSRFDDNRRGAFDEVDIDNVILDPNRTSSSIDARGSSRSPTRRQSARFLDEKNPVFSKRASSYDDGEDDDDGIFGIQMMNSSGRPSTRASSYDRSLSPARRSVLREQELAIERVRSSSSLLSKQSQQPLAVRTVPFEEPLVGANGQLDDTDESDFTSGVSRFAPSTSASDRSRRAVQRDQQRNIRRAKRGGFFSRFTRIGKAQLIDI